MMEGAVRNKLTNVKGTITAAQAFLPTANPAYAAILGLNAGLSTIPT